MWVSQVKKISLRNSVPTTPTSEEMKLGSIYKPKCLNRILKDNPGIKIQDAVGLLSQYENYKNSTQTNLHQT